MLVPDEHYAAVSDWIDGHHLKDRLVYYRVPAAVAGARRHHRTTDRARWPASSWSRTRRSPAWLDRELGRRADHACVETMAEFRRMPRAITKAGQVKGSGGRHEKDDRSRIDDRSRYVLGWTNERKLDALLDRAADAGRQLSEVAAVQQRHEKARDAAVEQGQVLAGLDQTHEFAEIDWQSVVNRAEQLRAEQRELEATSAELARLTHDLDAVKKRIASEDDALRALDGRLGGLDNRQHAAEGVMHDVREILAEDACRPARAQFAAIGELLAKARAAGAGHRRGL